MKKKLLFIALMVAMLICVFAISASAAVTSSSYAIEFKVMLEGDTEYTTVYTSNTDNDNPQITFDNGFFRNATYDDSTKKFTFSDEVDQSAITKIDFSNTTTLKSRGLVIKRVAKPTNPLTKCTEVKWFTASGSMSSLNQFQFQNWTALSSFDFGTLTLINDSAFDNTAFVNLVIPSQITQIKNTAFANCTSLKTVEFEGTLPNGIGSDMFKNCTALETATMNELTVLGVRMFKNCTALTTITAPNATVFYEEAFGDTLTGLTTLTINYAGITSVGKYAFRGLTCIPENLDLPSATEIGESAFYKCTGLKSVNLPNATTIKSNAFEGCTSLTTVSAPKVVTLSSKAFNGCTALKTVSKMPLLVTLGSEAFQNCQITSFEFTSAITSIGSKAFQNCTALTTVIFPETVSSMPLNGSTFSSCTSLVNINLPEGITALGNYELYQTAVTEIHIPSTVTKIGYQFAEKSNVETLTFAENSQLTFIDHRAFMECKSLTGVVILPEGLEEMDYGVFNSCTKLKAVKMPDTLTTLSGDAATFSGCTSLEYVQFSKNLTSPIYKSMFEGCTSLKAISFPDGITNIDYKALRKCTSLQAVYLPSGLTNLGVVSNSSNDWGVFYQSPNVYLVNEPFDVFDGDTLLGENFKMPEKPEVYYMPSGLVSFANSEFQDCNNLNNYIVFPVGITSITGNGAAQGAFYNIGKNRAENPVNLVFLGDMTELRIRQHQSDPAYSNVNYIFANPNDTDLNSLTLTIGSANNKALVNSYMYFCAGNVVYDLTTFVAPNSTVYTVQETDFTKTENTAETQPHFVDPNKTIITEADCENNEKHTTYCFCGAASGVTEVENTALGHNHDLENGATLLSIVYADYAQTGTYVIKCSRCDNNKNDATAPAFFVYQGFSDNNEGQMCVGYLLNQEAIKHFEEVNATKVEYGMVAAAVGYFGENVTKPLNADGTPVAENVIKVDVSSAEIYAVDFKLIGNFNAYANQELILSMYVYDGTAVKYVYSEGTSQTACYVDPKIITYALVTA